MRNLTCTETASPAKAGVHHVAPLKLTDEIGTSLRWCGVFWGAI